MKQWISESSLEGGIRNLPDRKPPADLRKRILLSLPEYKEPWYQRLRLSTGICPMFYRSAGALIGLALAFYGGLQFERLYLGSNNISAELLAIESSFNDEEFFNLGRSLLASGETAQALKAFSNAETLRPDNPKYTLWKASAYRDLGDLDKERQIYQQLIIKKPDLLQARLGLARNFLQDGHADKAQQLYGQILVTDPKLQIALYNRAIALRVQGNHAEEARAWKSYLDYYRTGDTANMALQHLHELGDYSFRKYQLGQRSVILNQDRLLDLKWQGQTREIEYLTRNLKEGTLGGVSIVVFVQDNVQQAKDIALSLRTAIANRKPTTGKEDYSVGFSWFDEAEPIETVDNEKISLSKGLLIFSTPKNIHEKESEI
jgi:tetratricopeptide (TPR) repeat protein